MSNHIIYHSNNTPKEYKVSILSVICERSFPRNKYIYWDFCPKLLIFGSDVGIFTLLLDSQCTSLVFYHCYLVGESLFLLCLLQ